MVEIYEGQVRVFTADKDSNAYTIKKGKRAGANYCRIAFPYNGENVYLADFSNEAAGYDGQVCKVAFSQKVDEFGDPILYNDKVQWNLDAIKPVGPAPAPAPGKPGSDAAPAPYNPGLGAMQSALKASAEVNAALIGQGIITDPLTFDVVGKVLKDAGRIHAALLIGSFDIETLEDDDISDDDETIPF